MSERLASEAILGEGAVKPASATVGPEAIGGHDEVARSEASPGWKPYAWCGGIVAVYYVGAVVLIGDLPTAWASLLAGVAGVSLVLLAVWLIVQFYTSAVQTRTRTAGGLKQELRARVLSGETWHRFLMLPLLLAGAAVFFDGFRTWKTAIPDLQPYAWDPVLAEIDAALHAGDSWRWTHRLFGGRGTAAIDWFYIWGWWGGKVGLLGLILTFDTLRRRLRYLLANIFTWTIGGTLIAVLLASGGPIFYARMGFGTRFRSLVTRIEAWAPTAAGTSDQLWQLYGTGQSPILAGGISAMPSMHVAAAVLLALWAWSVHRWLGVLLAANSVLIFVGSVHLGWHYAIDGYVGGALALGFWWLAGRVVPLVPESA